MTCKIWLSGEVEDEIHFHVNVSITLESRHLIATIEESFPEFEGLDFYEKFVFLMSHSECHTIIYLHEANQRRLQYKYHQQVKLMVFLCSSPDA